MTKEQKNKIIDETVERLRRGNMALNDQLLHLRYLIEDACGDDPYAHEILDVTKVYVDAVISVSSLTMMTLTGLRE